MNILHYTIGLPPKRNGGSVQYASDLICEQSSNNKVFVLVCGDTLFRGSESKIKKNGYFSNKKIPVYKLTSPSTPSLLYGVRNPNTLFKSRKIDLQGIRKLINDEKIEVFHIHTFMGLHKEIISHIKDLGVKIVYTSHDFYGICPHTNLFDYENRPCVNRNPEKCAMCNSSAPSDLFMRLSNSYLYQNLKKFVPSKKYAVDMATSRRSSNILDKTKIQGFDELLKYYEDCFSMIDLFLFNSTQTKEMYQKYISTKRFAVVPVITSGIKDLRIKREPHDLLRIGYVGNLSEYKGFFLLKKVLLSLKEEGLNGWELNVYGSIVGKDSDCSQVHYCGRYSHSDIREVLSNMDLVIVPSKCFETFSLITLEALAYGVPVMVSDSVGAKDIIGDIDQNFIFHSEDEFRIKLKNILLDKSILSDFNSRIMSMDWTYTMPQHALTITESYNIVCNE